MDGREKEEWRIAAQAEEAEAEAEMLSLKEAEIGLDDTAFWLLWHTAWKYRLRQERGIRTL